MFRDPVPEGADVILFSNVLHDWDVTDCYTLVARAAAALRPGSRLLVHDVFLNDAHDGPIPQALYSAALFCQTEGRLYSAAEVRTWLTAAGLVPGAVIPTRIHCGRLAGGQGYGLSETKGIAVEPRDRGSSRECLVVAVL